MSSAARPTSQRLLALPTWSLAQANARAHGLLAGALAASGLRGHHYRLLAALAEFGPASQAEVGRAVALDRSDVALGVDELERRGLVLRAPDSQDRRRKRVLLSPAGQGLLRDLDVVMRQVQEEFLEPLNAGEREILLSPAAFGGRLITDRGRRGRRGGSLASSGIERCPLDEKEAAPPVLTPRWVESRERGVLS